MPNIASLLKEEITRLARKELRNETGNLKKSSSQYRSEIAALKRRLGAIEKLLSRLEKIAARPIAAAADDRGGTPIRFSAKGLRTQRERLGLSAANAGTLLGVSAQTVYNWEAGMTRPREQQLKAIAALRGMGKREVTARLAEMG